jgi:hypothetical protein
MKDGRMIGESVQKVALRNVGLGCAVLERDVCCPQVTSVKGSAKVDRERAIQ